MSFTLLHVVTSLVGLELAFLAYWARSVDTRITKLEANALPVATQLAKLEVVMEQLNATLVRLEQRFDMEMR